MVLIFVRLVPVDITKLATHALDALRVALEKDKRLHALRHRIVFAAIALVGNTKIKMVSLAQHAHLIPLVLLARNNPTCLQGRRTVLVTVVSAANTKPMVLLPAACVIIVHQDMRSIL